MGWSIRLGRIAGTEVKIHLTFILFLIWIAVIQGMRGGPQAALEGVIFISLIFLCVLLHEFGHALAARRYGIPTPDITLLPIGGVARLQRMPEKPAQELVVALAGPMVNVVIALVLFLVLGGVADPWQLGWLEDPRISMLARLASVNVALVVFNLIPAFPMDGGRVLRAVLAMRLSYARATQIAARIGQGFAFVLGFLGLFYNPLLIFIAFFIYLGAAQENTMTQMQELARDVPVSEAMITDCPSLPVSATILDAARALLRTSQHDFPILDETGRVLGILTRDRIVEAITRGDAQRAVVEFMHADVPAVSVTDCLQHAFRIMQESQCSALPVLDRNQRLVGLITAENVGELFAIRSALSDGERPSWIGPAAGQPRLRHS